MASAQKSTQFLVIPKAERIRESPRSSTSDERMKIRKKSVFSKKIKEVVSRSRAEINEFVLGNDELIRTCTCPYCLRIHSRRDNCRVHIKNYHKGEVLRDFRPGVDATLEQVKTANESGKFLKTTKRARSSSAVPEGSYGSEDGFLAMFQNEVDPLQTILAEVDRQSRDKAGTSNGGPVSGSEAGKETRDVTPSSSSGIEKQKNMTTAEKSTQLLVIPKAERILESPRSSTSDERTKTKKRARDEVVSRSRAEIIELVLGNDELIRTCTCPYCLRIHSRRDNCRVHIKNYHKGEELRDFRPGVDATLEQVKTANESGKFLKTTKRARSSSAVPEGSYGSEDGFLAMFQQGVDPLQTILAEVDRQSRDEAGTSNGGPISGSEAGKETRDGSPSSSSGNATDFEAKSSIPLQPFGCVVCPCSFQRLKDLEKHVSSVHRTHFRCNACFAEFVQAQHLETHYLNTHVIE